MLKVIHISKTLTSQKRVQLVHVLLLDTIKDSRGVQSLTLNDYAQSHSLSTFQAVLPQ